MLETILHNLTNIGWAMLIFLCAYLSNVSFSLYYNIKVLLEPFSKEKLINSGLKITAFVCGLTLLCVAITTLPLFAHGVLQVHRRSIYEVQGHFGRDQGGQEL